MLTVYNSVAVLLKIEQILAVSDVDFLKAFVDYFAQLLPKEERAANQQAGEPCLTADEDVDFQPAAKKPSVETASAKKTSLKRIPKVKLEVSVKDISVAILETFEDDEPQALALKVCVHALLTAYHTCVYEQIE